MSIARSRFMTFLHEMPFDKIVRQMPAVPLGCRVWPPQTDNNDAKYNFRVDKGPTLPNGLMKLVFQANQNASNPGVRKFALKNSHRVSASTFLNPEWNPQRDAVIKAIIHSFDGK